MSLVPKNEFNGIEKNGITKKINIMMKYKAAKGNSFFEKETGVCFFIEKEFSVICSDFFSYKVPVKITMMARIVSVVHNRSIFEKGLCIRAAK